MTIFSSVTFPSGQTTTAVGTPPNLDPPIPFSVLPAPLQGVGTSVVYVAPNNSLFHLAGPNAGLEGVRLWQGVAGDQQWPFEQVLTRSPYIRGADINRQNYPERKFHIGVVIGSHNPPMTEYQYRMAEDNWWAGQDETNDGWLGIYTRFSGWRWIPVRPEATVTTMQKMDTTAYGNNVSTWDITLVAVRPWFTKPALYLTWQAATAGTPTPAPAALVTGTTPGVGAAEYYWGTLPIVNRGDMPSYVTFLVSSPGQAIVQDNSSSRLVPLPITVGSVGTFMCDTEPAHRTLVAANDPVDNLAADVISQSIILNFFLSGVASASTPLQLLFQNKFVFTVPAQTAVQFTVGHSNPAGVITGIVPQRFKRSR
jgi:hypothetical protein